MKNEKLLEYESMQEKLMNEADLMNDAKSVISHSNSTITRQSSSNLLLPGSQQPSQIRDEPRGIAVGSQCLAFLPGKMCFEFEIPDDVEKEINNFNVKKVIPMAVTRSEIELVMPEV